MQQGAFYHKVNSISFLLRHGNFFDLHIGGVAKVSIFGSQAKTLNQDWQKKLYKCFRAKVEGRTEQQTHTRSCLPKLMGTPFLHHKDKFHIWQSEIVLRACPPWQIFHFFIQIGDCYFVSILWIFTLHLPTPKGSHAKWYVCALVHLLLDAGVYRKLPQESPGEASTALQKSKSKIFSFRVLNDRCVRDPFSRQKELVRRNHQKSLWP